MTWFDLCVKVESGLNRGRAKPTKSNYIKYIKNRSKIRASRQKRTILVNLSGKSNSGFNQNGEIYKAGKKQLLRGETMPDMSISGIKNSDIALENSDVWNINSYLTNS